MTVYAELILRAIGTGYRLRIPHPDLSGVWLYERARLVGDWSDFGEPPSPHVQIKSSIGPLDGEAVQELLCSNLLHKLVRDQVANRSGWFEMGLDGACADFYCLEQ